MIRFFQSRLRGTARSFCGQVLASVAAVLALVTTGFADPEPAVEHPGAKIYRQMCADCHGANGEGVAEKYDEALVGKRSVASLTKYITRSMPEDQEGTCVGDDAANVATFIFDAFYSPAAQARIHPATESLSRLTVAQYRNSVADVFAHFRGGGDRRAEGEHGLKAEYKGRRKPEFGPQPPKDKDEEKQRRKERIRFERVDGQVAFRFGADSPNPLTMRDDDFSERWDGSVIATETGTYEFILKTENGARLWVNDPKEMLIDAWVSAGPEVREEKRTVFLLGGRAYPISLEHFKYKEKSASIELRWKPPHGREEVIPQSQLVPRGTPMSMVVATTFPADDRSDGYERGTTISKEWDAATTRAALEVVAHVEVHLDELARVKDGAPDRVEKLKDFSLRFAEAAWRRPLDEELRGRLIERQFAEASTPEVAVKRVVLLTLKSPRFLYPDLANDGANDDFSVASRLALALWDSVPDAPLAKKAREGKLRTPEQVASEARRMIADPRTGAKLHGFFHHWLELDRADTASKDPALFPGFDDSMMADLRESLWRFLDEVVWSDASDYRQLILANHLWLNERLAKFYGQPIAGAGFQRVDFDPNERAGVITHPYLLAALSYSRSTSPIHRGVFLSRNIAGVALKNPSVAVAFEDAKFDPSLTMREKVSELTKNASCMGCHSVINPLGFSLEHFDAVGRWRTEDNHKPVDAIGAFDAEEGHSVRLTGPKDVAAYAATSESAQRTFVRQLFDHTVKQPPGAFGEPTLENLRTHFAANAFNIQKLLAEIAVISATHDLAPRVPQVAQNAAPPAPSPTHH